jgi:hypothetical protein
MKKIKWSFILLVINLAVICFAMVKYLTIDYPIVGDDYSLALPSLLDSALHFRVAGLSIQWYTPSFGGGLPAYPNPNNSLFSLWTALTLLVQPFQAVIIAVILFIVVGGVAAYIFLRRVLKLNWSASILGVVFFSANGFMMERLAVGHLGYQAFPLLAVFLLLLLDASIPVVIAGLVFSLVVALLIQQAGYFLIVVFGLSLLIIFPLLYIYRPAVVSWKRIAAIIGLGGGVALVLSLSKMAAVYAFTREFPRQMADSYQTTIMKGLFGIVLQLLGPMNLAPLIKLIGQNTNSLLAYTVSMSGAYWYGYWEFDMSMSPVVFAIISAGVYQFIRKPRERVKWFSMNRKWLAWILLVFFTWLTIEFTLAKGLVYPLLEKLPILSSLHVNMRFAAAFILPLAIIAAIIYNKWSSGLSSRKAWLIFVTVDIIALLPLSIYFLIKSDLVVRSYNVTESQQIDNLIRSGDPMTITGITSGASNTDALLFHESDLHPYEPIFGYALQNFHPEVHAGSIWEVSGGYYNMTDPSGYVFPEVNNSRPFERIPVSEKAQLEAFASYKQPGWKIPLYQQVFDWVSGVSILGVVAMLAYFGVRKLVEPTQGKGSK